MKIEFVVLNLLKKIKEEERKRCQVQMENSTKYSRKK